MNHLEHFKATLTYHPWRMDDEYLRFIDDLAQADIAQANEPIFDGAHEEVDLPYVNHEGSKRTILAQAHKNGGGPVITIITGSGNVYFNGTQLMNGAGAFAYSRENLESLL